MFTPATLLRIKSVDKIIDMKKYPDDLRMFFENNWKTEQRKNGSRDEKTVRFHSAIGLATEKALDSIMKDNSPIVEDADELDYAERQIDKVCEGLKVSIKSSKLNYEFVHNGHWFISPAQLASIKRSQAFCDVAIVMGWEHLGSFRFRVMPKFVANNKKIDKYLVDLVTSPGYRFDPVTASNAGDCIIMETYGEQDVII
jgi:hypothetical protein